MRNGLWLKANAAINRAGQPGFPAREQEEIELPAQIEN
jgi:hypothetical protein